MGLQLETGVVGTEVDAHGWESATTADFGHAPGVGIWEQSGYDVRLDWGGEGVAALGRECAVLVVVDVLSFNTTTDLVVGRGGRVLPVRWRDARSGAGEGDGAVIAGEAASPSGPHLNGNPAGDDAGAPLPQRRDAVRPAAAHGARVLAGCLRNASAVARRPANWAARSGSSRPGNAGG